jgi:hypothetical protein
MLVCTLGDLTLDVVVRLAAPIAAGGDTDAEIRIGPGGQAANVAAWVSELGAQARFIGKTGAAACNGVEDVRAGSPRSRAPRATSSCSSASAASANRALRSRRSI